LSGPTNEKGSESPENATLIALAALILASVGDAGACACAPPAINAAAAM
jgi:hypothetical protein